VVARVVTLRDAAQYIVKLSKAEQHEPEWQAATEVLMLIGAAAPETGQDLQGCAISPRLDPRLRCKIAIWSRQEDALTL
jgi:hypothetical protein